MITGKSGIVTFKYNPGVNVMNNPEIKIVFQRSKLGLILDTKNHRFQCWGSVLFDC